MTNQLIYNAIQTPDGTVIESTHRHDFVCHTDAVTGKTYCVDGGLEYLRRVGDVGDCEDISLYDDQDFSTLREYLKWGTRGKEGDQPLEFKPIKNLDTSHLHALLYEYEGPVSPVHKKCMEKEYKLRTKEQPLDK